MADNIENKYNEKGMPRSIQEYRNLRSKIENSELNPHSEEWLKYAESQELKISENDRSSYVKYFSVYHKWCNKKYASQKHDASPEKQDWLKKRYPNRKYSNLDILSVKNLNDEYNVFNSWLQKEENGDKTYRDLSDKERKSKLSDFSKEFKSWLKDNGYRSFYELSQVELMYALAEYKVQLDKDRTNENDDKTLHISENRNQDTQNDKTNENQDESKRDSSSNNDQNNDENNNSDTNKKEADWITKKRQSWKDWCEDDSVHNPNYIYDEQPSAGLKFDVYKTDKDKEEGNKAASIEYKSPRDVVIDNTDNNVPDYEFFAKLTKDAKEHDKVPGVTFNGEMTPEFQARLAASCIENDLKMVGGPDHIDVNLLGNVSEELKQKVNKYNYLNSTREKVQKNKENKDSSAENQQNNANTNSSEHSVDPAVLAAQKRRRDPRS